MANKNLADAQNGATRFVRISYTPACLGA